MPMPATTTTAAASVENRSTARRDRSIRAQPTPGGARTRYGCVTVAGPRACSSNGPSLLGALIEGRGLNLGTVAEFHRDGKAASQPLLQTGPRGVVSARTPSVGPVPTAEANPGAD